MQQPDISTFPQPLHRVCRRIRDRGGRGWLVGGSVRDLLLGLAPKDFDIEVYGLHTDAMLDAVRELGRCQEVGRHFGVVKLLCEGVEIDLALPRTEIKRGPGHRAFDVLPNPALDEETASERRDFTINAMMLDPLSGELLDFHRGKQDLENRILRHVSSAFVEDPLRPLRGMQFASRFGLTLDEDTATLCQALLAEADSLADARIWEEWRKWAHGDYPSRGLDVLRHSGWLNLYPELMVMIGCEQEPQWHPEGDVWIHTRLVLDRAAEVAKRYGWNGRKRERLVFAALCHDLGKPKSTFVHTDGRIRSTGHAAEGVPPAKVFLQAIYAPEKLTSHVLPLVAEHLVHLHGKPTPRAVRRLAHRLEPADIEMWEALVEADASGRPPLPPSRPALPWLEEARSMTVQSNAPEPLANGTMLLDMGMQAGPGMGEWLGAAYQAQLDGEFSDEDGARRWLSQKLAKH